MLDCHCCRQHEASRAGQDSPGPAAYDAAAAALAGTVLGDRRTACFGRGTGREAGDSIESSAPGPGAYLVDEVWQLHSVSSLCQSIGKCD